MREGECLDNDTEPEKRREEKNRFGFGWELRSGLGAVMVSPLLYAGSDVSSTGETGSFQLVESPTPPASEDSDSAKEFFGRLVGSDAFRGSKA